MNISDIQCKLTELFPAIETNDIKDAGGDPYLLVPAKHLKNIALALRDISYFSFNHLRLITGIDQKECLSSVYHLYSYKHFHSLVLRVDVSKENPIVPTVSDIWPTADWQERESFDMVGIVYDGHPNLTRILLPQDWEGHPLRKDYKTPKEYNGIRND